MHARHPAPAAFAATPASPFGARGSLATALALVLACAIVVLGLAEPAAAATMTGSGRSATVTRTPGDFDAIAVSGPIELRIRRADSPAVTVTADDNLVELVETVVERGDAGATLRIGVRRGASLRTHSPIRVVVDATQLRAIAAAGSGDIVLEAFETPALAVSTAGSGEVELSGLRTASLSLRMAGSGDLRAAGAAAELELAITGSGNADLQALQADAVQVSIAGSGDASVTANRSLRVRIAGSGDVRYGGGVTDVRSAVVGSGTVRPR